jgi:hypothetical protein
VEAIARTTLANVDAFVAGDLCRNAVTHRGSAACSDGEREG